MPRWSEVVQLPGGGTAFVCYSGKQRRNLPSCACGARSTLQCDFPLLAGQTCDAFLCRRCAVSVGHNQHLCPVHPKDGAA